MRHSRRIAKVPISWEIMAAELLPEGSQIEDATYNFMAMTVDLIVSHPDLDPVDPGAVLPTVAPLITTESVVVKRTIEW